MGSLLFMEGIRIFRNCALCCLVCEKWRGVSTVYCPQEETPRLEACTGDPSGVTITTGGNEIASCDLSMSCSSSVHVSICRVGAFEEFLKLVGTSVLEGSTEPTHSNTCKRIGVEMLSTTALPGSRFSLVG